jgi:hypothetical protein
MDENGFNRLGLKIGEGVYFKPDAFKGNLIQKQELIHLSDGTLGLTNLHIHFSGANDHFKIRYDQIVSFIPYDDGFGILEYDSTANPKIFYTGDGWFSYNLITNIARLS